MTGLNTLNPQSGNRGVDAAADRLTVSFLDFPGCSPRGMVPPTVGNPSHLYTIKMILRKTGPEAHPPGDSRLC